MLFTDMAAKNVSQLVFRQNNSFPFFYEIVHNPNVFAIVPEKLNTLFGQEIDMIVDAEHLVGCQPFINL
jgi:hypothetical protein